MLKLDNKHIEFDKNDILKHFKHKFINDDSTIYLDGNSLGKLPVKSKEMMTEMVAVQWGHHLIKSWNDSWIHLSGKIAKKIAKLIGAQPDEVFVGDSTSLNLFKLMYGICKMQDQTFNIVTDNLNFPSDLYVIQGLLENHFKNGSLHIVEGNNEVDIDPDRLFSVVNEQTALITLSYVSYKSAFLYPMKEINAIALKKKTTVLWDLSHAVGAVPINVCKDGTELAVGCTYKYLNGGPGAPAFLYVKKSLQERMTNPIWSWFSHDAPFTFDPEYRVAQNIEKFAISTPTILSMAPVEIGVDLLLEAGIQKLREKSVGQSAYLLELIKKELVPLGFEICSPLDASKRGSHISLSHLEAYRINEAMIHPKLSNRKAIIPDFRPPNMIRLGIAPLYTTYADLAYTVARIKEIVIKKEYDALSNEKKIVT